MKNQQTMFRIILSAALLASLCFGYSISFAQTAGDYMSKTSGNWNSTSTWLQWDGISWTDAFDAPSTGFAVHIQAPHVVTVTANVSVDSVIVDTLSSLVINSGVTMTVVLSGTVSGGGRISAADSAVTVLGTLQIARDGGSIPKARWQTGSTCLITGAVSSAPSNGSQNYYNFTWECRGQTASLNPGWFNNTIFGNVNVLNTGTKGGTLWFLRLTSNANSMGVGTPNIITVNGNVNVNGDSTAFTISGSSGSVHNVIVKVMGNLNLLQWYSTADTASFQLANGSGCQGNWWVYGNVSLLGKSVGTNSTAGTMADTLVLCGTGTQTFTNGLKNGNLTNWKIAVRPGSTMAMDASSTLGVATGTTFTLPAGATFASGHANGLNGNLTIPTAPALNASANYILNGTVAQVPGALLVNANDLTINNAAGVTTSQIITVSGLLHLQAGYLNDCAFAVAVTPGNIRWEGGILCSVGVEEGYMAAPTEFKLLANFPNPFNPSTEIRFSVPKDGYATVKVLNILGQEVTTLFNGMARAGQFIPVTFNAAHMASGVYFARLEYNGLSKVQRMVLMK